MPTILFLLTVYSLQKYSDHISASEWFLRSSQMTHWGEASVWLPQSSAAENDLTMSNHDMKKQLYTLLAGSQSAY